MSTLDSNRGGSSDSEVKPTDNAEGKLVLGFLAIVAMIVGMVATIYYPWPGGKFGVGDFIEFWFRELILVGALVGALIFVALVWLWKTVRSLFARDKSAL